MTDFDTWKTKANRWWVFTINNWTEDDLAECEKLASHRSVRYLVYGKEIGKQGTPHLQGFIELKRTPQRWSWLRKRLTRAWLDPKYPKSTRDHARNYCLKDGDFTEFGEWIPDAQGTRTDLKEITDAITRGETSVDTLALEHPKKYHLYARTFSKVEDLALRARFRTWMTTCTWFYGPSGTGKSHRAYEGYDPKTHYIWKDDNGWQDGYTGQPIVIINEFRGGIRYDEFLQLVDKWPYHLRRRGREPAPFLAKHIIVTSALSPSQLYCRRHEADDIEQLKRRVKVVHLTEKYSD